MDNHGNSNVVFSTALIMLTSATYNISALGPFPNGHERQAHWCPLRITSPFLTTIVDLGPVYYKPLSPLISFKMSWVIFK